MNEIDQIVIFKLNKQKYALHLSAVIRIVLAAEITLLPKAPEIVLGVINVQGEILPVVDIKKRFNLPERDILINDQLIIAKTSKRRVTLLVDEVIGLVDYDVKKIIKTDTILPHLQYVEGIAKIPDPKDASHNLVLIHDLEKFLSFEEEKTLDAAIRKV